MVVVRACVSSLLAAAGFVLVAGPGLVSAQPAAKDTLPVRPGNYGEVAILKAAGGIPKGELAKAKAAFDGFARFYAEYVSHPRVYTAPQEFRPEPPPPGSPLTVDQLINELNRHLLIPSPVPVPNPVANQASFALASGANDADYVRELGTALDKALGDTVKGANERVVRVNAARLLAAAARSGAHAHYPTVTELLTAPNVDPEVRYYALQAAANLLSAYDLNDYRSRKHSNEPKPVGDLVAALQNAVLKADALVPVVDVAEGKSVRKVVPPELVGPYQFIRRQAVRALAEVRFAEIDAEKGKTLYPAHTLALVALGKAPVETARVTAEGKVEFLTLPRPPADAIEAVIGICTMAPPKGGAAGRQYAPPMADVIATGVIAWATPRAADPTDKSLPWKGTGVRLDAALKTWQGLYDVNFNPAQPVINAGLVPPAAAGVAKAITDNITDPLASPTRTLGVQQLVNYQRDVLRRSKDLTPRPFLAPTAPVLPLDPPQ